MTTPRADARPPTTGRGARRRTPGTPGTPGTPALTVLRTGYPGPLNRGQRERLLVTAGELAWALLAGRPIHDVLQLIADRAGEGTAAALALLGSSTDSDRLVVEADAGQYSCRLRGRHVLLTPMPGQGLALDLGQTPGGDRRFLVLLGLPDAGRTAAVRALRAFAEQTALAFRLADERALLERGTVAAGPSPHGKRAPGARRPAPVRDRPALAGATGLVHDSQTRRAPGSVGRWTTSTSPSPRSAPPRSGSASPPAREDHTSSSDPAPASASFFGTHPPDGVATDHDPASDRRHPAGHRMAVERSNQAADQAGQQFAGLMATASGGGSQIGASLDAVLLLARAACPSCLAVTLTVDHESQPVTVTAMVSTGQRHAPSLTVRLPRANTSGPARRPAVLVVFANDMVALARLADDVTSAAGDRPAPGDRRGRRSGTAVHGRGPGPGRAARRPDRGRPCPGCAARPRLAPDRGPH